MVIVRLYTGADGESHAEELPLDAHPELFSPRAAKQTYFQMKEPGFFVDWHPAAGPRYVITLSGGWEIGLADGSAARFGPGDVLIAEDLTGRGHTTRGVGDQPRMTAWVDLRDEES
ncbi:MAG: hypothetical protein IT307_01235 [Chloroflexi bacterium]|nr:hypothetical protein [Chloroflexota bacterium]